MFSEASLLRVVLNYGLRGKALINIVGHKIKTTQKLRCCFGGRVENSVGKGKNVGFLHFLLFLLCFEMPFCSGLLKVRVVR